MQSDDILTGALRFSGGRRSASHWVRLKANVEPRRLVELLTQVWSHSLSKPSALLSVIGGSTTSDFISMPPHDALEFSRGFGRAAQATSAWVISGGTSAGVNHLVGGALHDVPQVPCFGVVQWSAVEHREALARHASAGVLTLPTGRTAFARAPGWTLRLSTQ